jgi:hypothetical protein
VADDSNRNERMHNRICRNAAVIHAHRRDISIQEAIKHALMIERGVATVLLEALDKEAVDNNA